MHSNENRGIVVLNPQPIGRTATIAATGLGRSGTTMVARIMGDLGLDMGDDLKPRSREDWNIQSLAKQGDTAGFESYCRTRDAEAERWAFKVPALRGYINEFTRVMRDPRVIITFRDVLAITLRNNLAVGTDVFDGLRSAILGYKGMVEQIAGLECPVLLISYEKSLQYPVETVASIAEFCGVSESEADFEAVARQSVMNGDPRYIESA